jgi:hypothetical protein
MSGERELSVLMKSLAPVLDGPEYTFVTVPESEASKFIRPIGLFREREGVSIVCTCAEAEQLGVKSGGAFRRITLMVHSSLESVGLTACVAAALASEGIACNVIAGFHHDHLFIPAKRASEAMMVLHKLSA